MSVATSGDLALLADVTAIVRAGGARLRERFNANAPGLRTRDEIFAALHANDQAVFDVLCEPLLKVRPGAGWVEDELDSGPLPPGEWWVVDPAEGNVNHVHGMTDWAVTATLVRDNTPVLTVVHLPPADTTYTAVAGEGAYQDGRPLWPSSKSTLDSAYVGTGPARPDEDAATTRRLTESLHAMLDKGLVARASVPATLQLVHVAAGRMDVFWQYSDVRADQLAGALLVSEAGGVVTDTQGAPWSLASSDFLAAAPGVHQAAVEVLAGIR